MVKCVKCFKDETKTPCIARYSGIWLCTPCAKKHHKFKTMSTKAKRHIHRYHKITVGSSKVWACALPDCNHYMPAHMSMMAPGKASLCWDCDEQMILDEMNMKADKPLCGDCSGKNSELMDLVEILEHKHIS